MSEFEVKYLAGHKMSSRMANVYIHTNDQDVANKERIRRGLKPLETSGKIKKHHLATLKCTQCGNVNPATFQFCFSCGDPIGDTELSRQKKFLKIIEKAEDDHRIKRVLNLLEDIMTKPHPV